MCLDDKQMLWFLLGTDEASRAAQCVPMWRVCPLSVGCQVIIWKTWLWIILGNMFGECQITYMLKNFFL